MMCLLLAIGLAVNLQVAVTPIPLFGHISEASAGEPIIRSEWVGINDLPKHEKGLCSSFDILCIGRTHCLQMDLNSAGLSRHHWRLTRTGLTLWLGRGGRSREASLPTQCHIKSRAFPIIFQYGVQNNRFICLQHKNRWSTWNYPGSFVRVQSFPHSFPLHIGRGSLNGTNKSYDAGKPNHPALTACAGVFLLGLSCLSMIWGVSRGVSGHGWQSAAAFTVALIIIPIGLGLIIFGDWFMLIRGGL